MATFEIAKLLNKIKDDIPGINAVVKALAKWDVSAFTDVPEGAMQATVDTEKRLTFKRLLSGTWAPIGKIMHDVDTVDGYHASASATQNALAVRDNNGALPGNILGNAATATESEKLSAGAVVPVNQGGTGATTSSGARANLGAASDADFTAHENLQGGPTWFGHVMLDGMAADGTATAAPGGYGLGNAASITANEDLDLFTGPGFYSCPQNVTVATLKNCPTAFAFSLLVETAAYGPSQTIKEYSASGKWFYRSKHSVSAFSAWVEIPRGISNVLNGTNKSYAASEYALAQVYAAAQSAVVPVNTGATHIYISKTGNDSKDGRSEGNAVATWARAEDIASSMRYSRGMNLYFHFGPGDWGNVTVNGISYSNAYVRVTSIRTTTANGSDYADIPKFKVLSLYNTEGTVNNVVVDFLSVSRKSFISVISYIRFAACRSEYNSYLIFSTGTHDIYADSVYTYLFSARYCGILQSNSANTVFNFVEKTNYGSGTLSSDWGGIVQFRGDAGFVSFTGPIPNNYNFRIAIGSSVLVYLNESYNFFPGNGTWTIASAATYNGSGDTTSTTGDFVVSFTASKVGHLLCIGSEVSRTTYANLFDKIGTTYGAGNGSTTFNLPDARNKTLWGASGNLGAVLAAGLPNITGAFAVGALCGSFSGAIYNANNASTQRSTTDANSPVKAVLDASRSSPIYGKSTTVQPPSLALNVFIKY